MTEQVAEQQSEYASEIEIVRKKRRELIEALKKCRPSLYPRHLLTEALGCEKCHAVRAKTKEHWFHVEDARIRGQTVRALHTASFADLIMFYCPRHGHQILNAIYAIWEGRDFDKVLADNRPEQESDLEPENMSEVDVGISVLQDPWNEEALENLTPILKDSLLSTGYYEQDKDRAIRPILRKYEGSVRAYGNDMMMRDVVREAIVRTADSYKFSRVTEKPESRTRIPNADITPHTTLLCSKCKGGGKDKNGATCENCRGIGTVQEPTLMKKSHPEFGRFVKETAPLYTKRMTKSQRKRHVDKKLHADAKENRAKIFGDQGTKGWKGVNYLNPRKRTRKPGELRVLKPTETIEARRRWRRDYMRDYRKGLRRKPPL